MVGYVVREISDHLDLDLNLDLGFNLNLDVQGEVSERYLEELASLFIQLGHVMDVWAMRCI